MPTIATLDLVALHQAIVDTLQAGGIEQVYPCWFDSIEPPCIVVVGAPSAYTAGEGEQTFRMGIERVQVTLMMFGHSETIEGQQQIMRWLSRGIGEPTVKDALRPLVSGVPDSSFGLDGVSFAFGESRYAAAVIYPEGSNTRYALGELDLTILIETPS